MHLAARVVRRDEVLRAVLDPLHGPTEAKRRERDEHVLGIQLAADAEAAADVDLDEPHVARARARAAPRAPLRLKCFTFAAPQIVSAAAGGLREEAPCLQRRARLSRKLEAAADDDVRLRERRIDVAVADGKRVDDVRAEQPRGRAAPRAAAATRSSADLEQVEIELDELGGILGDPRILGERRARPARRRSARRRGRAAAGARSARGRRREREPDRDAHVRHVGGGQHGEHAAGARARPRCRRRSSVAWATGLRTTRAQTWPGNGRRRRRSVPAR